MGPFSYDMIDWFLPSGDKTPDSADRLHQVRIKTQIFFFNLLAPFLQIILVIRISIFDEDATILLLPVVSALLLSANLLLKYQGRMIGHLIILAIYPLAAYRFIEGGGIYAPGYRFFSLCRSSSS